MGNDAEQATPRKSPRLAKLPCDSTPSRASPSPGKQGRGQKKASSNKKQASSSKKGASLSKKAPSSIRERKYTSQLKIDETEFSVGDDVYVIMKAGDGEESDEELEECRVCGEEADEAKEMVECDKCLGGFHLSCLNPPLDSVPSGDWMCSGCENASEPMAAPRSRHRTARERLLTQDLCAARIQRLWKQPDGSMWFSGRWYLVPEATKQGRQDHHGRRELYRTNHVDENEIESVLRQCYVFTPDEFAEASSEGDDVFYCEYEYDVVFHTYKRINELEEADEVEDDEEYELDEEDDRLEQTKRGLTPKRRKSSGSTRGTPKRKADEVDEDEDRLEEAERGATRRRGQSSGSTRRTPNKKARTEITGLENLKKRSLLREDSRPLTEIEKAKAALVLSAVPDSLPCREREKSEIEAFVVDVIGKGSDCLGKCLYISGVPGTGKTATVLDVMKSMQRKLKAKEIQPFQFVELNGLRLTSPEQTYTVLHEAFTGQRLGWKKALQLLDERFSGSKSSKGGEGRPCILLVDELDLLVTRSQSVLYNLFDWPCRPKSGLVVIGIANTIDLPERLLPRIASRMGLQRVSFSPYSYTQLQQIISYRLSGTEAFEKPAVEFASRKVAAVSGDARRALELCRRAAEIAEARQGSSIGMNDVEAAVNEMFQAPHVQVMRRCSKHAKIFLVAMVYEYLRSGMAETTFEQVSRSHTQLCQHNGEQAPSKDNLLLIGCRLGESRLLLCESGSRHRLQKLQLNFPSDDVSFALKDTPELPWIAKYLNAY